MSQTHWKAYFSKFVIGLSMPELNGEVWSHQSPSWYNIVYEFQLKYVKKHWDGSSVWDDASIAEAHSYYKDYERWHECDWHDHEDGY